LRTRGIGRIGLGRHIEPQNTPVTSGIRMSKFRRGALLAAVSSAAFLATAFAASAETLADAIALAYETNPTLQAQRASQRALDESVVQARASGYRPQISGAATAGWSKTDTPGGGGFVDTNG